MKKNQFSTIILISLTLGLLTVFIVPANALEITINFGPLPPPPPPPLRYTAPPEPVYAEFDSNVVLELGSVYFSLDYPIIYGYYRDYDLTPDEVIYILYLSHYCHRPPLYIINMYRQRHDWSIVIGDIGLSSDAPRWIRDRDAYSIAALYATSDYYRVPYTQVYQIHQRGYRSAEIVAAVNVSSRSGKPVGDILIDRSKGKKWEDIAKENKTSFDAIKAPREKGKSVKFGAPLTEPGLKAPAIKAPAAGKGPAIKAPEAGKAPALKAPAESKAPETRKAPALKAPAEGKAPAKEKGKAPALKAPAEGNASETRKAPALKAPAEGKGPAKEKGKTPALKSSAEGKAPETRKAPAIKAPAEGKGLAKEKGKAPAIKAPAEGKAPAKEKSKGPALKGHDAGKGSEVGKESAKGNNKGQDKEKDKENK